MSKTQYYTASSLDGFIADTRNSLDWLFASGNEEASGNEDFAAFFASIGAFCMGRTTYEWILDHEKLIDDPAKWQTYYGSIPCWIFSHKTLPAIPGAVLHFVSGDVASVHASMKQAANGKNIWVAGGGELVGQFADAGLLDELILAYAPVMLGGGAPLLPRRITSERLKLLSAEKRGPFLHATYSVGPQKP